MIIDLVKVVMFPIHMLTHHELFYGLMSLTPVPCVTSRTWDIMFWHGEDISSCEVTRLMIVSWDKLIGEETIVFCSNDRIKGRRHKRHVNFVLP